MNNFQYDAIIVLGGGRNENGLTELSKQRLDAGAKVFQESKADTICEAFAVAQWCLENEASKVDLVTSDKHMERAHFIFNEVFRRIFKGKKFEIGKEEVP